MVSHGLSCTAFAANQVIDSAPDWCHAGEQGGKAVATLQGRQWGAAPPDSLPGPHSHQPPAAGQPAAAT